jgi:integrase
VICAREDGALWNPAILSQMFAKWIVSVDVPRVRFHDLRHTHATLLFKVGEHPKVVSERLGHASVKITLDTYSHVLPGMQAGAASKLDAVLRQAAGEAGTDPTG